MQTAFSKIGSQPLAVKLGAVHAQPATAEKRPDKCAAETSNCFSGRIALKRCHVNRRRINILYLSIQEAVSTELQKVSL
jgi:hypothetical protein